LTKESPNRIAQQITVTVELAADNLYDIEEKVARPLVYHRAPDSYHA
jgi:hypothetical protein